MSVALFSGTGFETALGSCSADPTISDGDNATGPDQTGPVDGDSAYTAIYDAGTTVTFTAANAKVGYEGALTDYWEVSTNGTSWMGLGGTILPDHGGAFSLEDSGAPILLGYSARYIRYSAKDTASGGHTSRVSIREIVPSYTGAPVVYTEAPQINLGAKLSSAEADVLVDAPQVKLGAKPGGADELDYAGGGREYGESPRVKLGAKPGGVDAWVAVEAPRIGAALALRETDEQRNVTIPTIFYDAVRIHLGAAAQMDSPEIGVGVDAVPLGLGVKPGGSSQAVTADLASVHLGAAPRGVDRAVWLATGQANLGAKPGVSDQIVGKDAVKVPVGMRAIYSGSVVGLDNVSLKLGAKPGGSDVVVDVDAPSVPLGARPVYSGSVVGLDAATMKMGAKPGGANTSTLTERPRAPLGITAASAEKRGYIETPVVRMGMRVSCTETQVGVE